MDELPSLICCLMLKVYSNWVYHEMALWLGWGKMVEFGGEWAWGCVFKREMRTFFAWLIHRSIGSEKQVVLTYDCGQGLVFVGAE